MAGRDYKVGLDYFELDCHFDDDVKLVQAEYGLKAFAVIVKLWQKIYGERGYYCEWNEDVLLLFMSENGMTCDNKNLISGIISACIRRNLFSGALFKKYGILTSSGVQKRYLKAVSRRERVELIKEYLLISVGRDNKNVVIKSISDGRNAENDTGNKQSREEKSREENNTMCTVREARALFEKLWKLYPCKKGKGSVSDTQKLKLLKIGFEEMQRAVDRYVSYVEGIDYLHYKNGSTFFNSGYIDYLDANYVPDKKPAKQAGQFGQFMQQDYDFDQLEREILSN
ncbi:DUF4373 domain-containing protein [Parablautia intestinalis]|uniref:DUF4373 domain-containing protein n=1 Tax=Parablautia intestinalis TaxID=2320100 RepID=UPI00256F231F|nr:DUF4373 domain-containing protein [Parablautia intestinalis]